MAGSAGICYGRAKIGVGSSIHGKRRPLGIDNGLAAVTGSKGIYTGRAKVDFGSKSGLLQPSSCIRLLPDRNQPELRSWQASVFLRYLACI